MKKPNSLFYGYNIFTPAAEKIKGQHLTAEERIKQVQKNLPDEKQSIKDRKAPVFNHHHIALYTRDYLRKKVKEAKVQNDSIDKYINDLPDSKNAISYRQLYHFIMEIFTVCKRKYRAFSEHPVITTLFKHTNLIEACISLKKVGLLDRTNFRQVYLLTEKEQSELHVLLSKNNVGMSNRVTQLQLDLLKKVLPYHQPWLHDLFELITTVIHGSRMNIMEVLSLPRDNRKALHTVVVNLLNQGLLDRDSFRIAYLKIAKKLDESISKALQEMHFNLTLPLELVRAGGNPHVANEAGETILHRYVQCLIFDRYPADVCISTLQELTREWGANINIENCMGSSPWDLFMNRQRPDHVQYAKDFLEMGADFKRVLHPEYANYLSYLRTIRKINHDADAFLGVLSKKFNTMPKSYNIPEYMHIDSNLIKKSDNKLGSGGYGTVHSGTMNHLNIAIKRTHIKNYDDFLEELNAMHKMMSYYKCNVIQVEGYDINVREGYCYIYMELAQQGSLHDMYNKESPRSFRVRYGWIKEIVNGVEYIHERNFIHADLKSHNVLIGKDGRARICDFGLSTTADCFVMPCGTSVYMAPEVRDNAPNTMASDIYSLALTMYEVMLWKFAFYLMGRCEVDSITELRKDVQDGFRANIDPLCPPKLAHLITWGWSQKPEDRPVASQLALELNGGMRG